MVEQAPNDTEPTGNPEIHDYDPEKPGLKPPEKKPELNLEEGSAKITLRDVYVMFYILVKQSEQVRPGSKMSFDLRAFKNLPKKISVSFEKKDGRLFVWIPEKPKDRKKLTKSKLFLPDDRIITLN